MSELPAASGQAGASEVPAASGQAGASEVPAHIVDAARHVLAQDGLAAATLERISAAAGVSRMTLHRHGVSKRDILAAIAARLEGEYRDALWPVMVAPGTGAERLRLALGQLCAVTEGNLAMLEALSAAARGEIYHEPGEADTLTRPVFVEPLQRLLVDGAADGTLATVDQRETATVLFNLIGHTYRHLRSAHGWSPRRARAGVVGLVLEGVLARP